jgi:hypothetical protein
MTHQAVDRFGSESEVGSTVQNEIAVEHRSYTVDHLSLASRDIVVYAAGMSEARFVYSEDGARFRFYDPETRRFTQEYPVKDGADWYVYVRDNPLMWVEEYVAIGLKYQEDGNITENDIRAEHNLPLRGGYEAKEINNVEK